MIRIAAVFVSMTALLVAAGCSGSSGPSLVPVTGSVSLDGKPLEGADIVFTPDGSNANGEPATDTTGASGNYTAMTRGRKGMIPGKYKVLVTKSTIVVKDMTATFGDDPYMAELTSRPPKSRTPRKDDDAGKIEQKFEREVPADGGVLDFDLKLKGSASSAGATASNR